MVRFSMRRREGNGTEVHAELRERGVDLEIQAPEGSELRAPARVEVMALSNMGGSTELPVTLERTAPGRWVARGPTNGQQFVVARVLDDEGHILSETVGTLDSEAELSDVEAGPDTRALRELASVGGGLFAPEPAQTLREGGPRGAVPVLLWPWMLLLAAALTALDVWLRRLGRGRRQAISRLIPSKTKEPEPPTEEPTAKAA